MELNVYSEVGELKKVLLHRPSNEIENITPELLGKLLFDDIPYLEVAQQEHDFFANLLRNEGVEVFYLAEMAAESIKDDNIKLKFIMDYLEEANIYSDGLKEAVLYYLLGMDNESLIHKTMEGIRKEEIDFSSSSLTDFVNKDYPFVCDPIPNLYFTRDPFVTIGRGIALNHMHTVTRRRETLYSKYIFKYHPEFENMLIPFWYHREDDASIEGGDILILNDHVMAIGISQRTEPRAIEKIALRIFKSKVQPERQPKIILAFHIPSTRAFMHLDTVFTQVDHNKFTVHSDIDCPIDVYALKLSGNGLKIDQEKGKLEKILSKYLEKEIKLIKCGNGDKVTSGREQWNDGSNTLAIRPGEVVVYSRNYVTNRVLEANGVKLHIIPSSELSRGRGGPRCMSMPLYRKDIN